MHFTLERFLEKRSVFASTANADVYTPSSKFDHAS